MKIIRQFTLIFVAAFLWSTASFGQNQWTRQSPLPAARNLWGAAWATATHGFASGESETLVETFDGGATWRNVNLGVSSSDPFYNVYCRDAANCFVIGNGTSNGPDHWRTTDSGATWQQITNFPNGGSWRQVDFVSASVGFMGSNGATAHTTDGGATWTLMSFYPDCPVIYGMDFRDAQVGVAAGDRVSTIDGGPGIFKTTDAGVTWVRKSSLLSSDVLWLNNTTAIVSVLGPIYRSTDTGETWLEISNQISTGGFDKMTLLPNGTIVGVSGTGDAWRSADGGLNWTQTLVGLGALPASWNVSFFDNQIGLIVGQSGFIFKTTDGGLTWAMLNNGIGVEFRDLEMFDDSAGLAVGDDGYFLRTENGGNHWETGRLQVTGVVVGRNEHLQAVSIVDANFAVAAGFDGVVYKTFDRGATWQSIGYPNLPSEYFISDVKFINHNLGYVTGSRPGIAEGLFRTTDGGATWTPVYPNGGYSIDFIDANRGWVLNTGGLGYRTTDGGATWQQMLLPNQGFTPSILKLDFINQNDGWAVGWDGYAAHTTNGGATWQLQNIAPSQDVIIGLHVWSGTEVFAVGRSSVGSGTFYHTSDAGATWSHSPLPSQYSLSSIFAAPSRRLWASGYDGTVLYNPNSTGPTPITISGTISYCSNPVPGPVPNVTLNLTGTMSGTTLSDGSGNYSFSSLPSGGNYVVTPTKTALTPGSAGINTVDVIAIQRHFLALGTPLSGCRLTAADVDLNTAINTVDVIAVQRFFLGLSTGTANTGKYQFSPVNRSYFGLVSNQTGQNYDTLVFGDVASTFVGRPEDPSQIDGMSASEVSAPVATVTLPEVAGDQSRRNFVAAVRTTAIDAKNKLVGFQGDFTFDERVVTFESEPVQRAGLTLGNWNVSGNVLAGAGPIRTLRISAYSNDFAALTGSGTLFELRMTRVNKAAQGAPLIWAAASGQFIFIDADLQTHKPGYAAPGSIAPSEKRK